MIPPVIALLATFIQRYKGMIMGGVVLCVWFWSSDATATALEQQLDRINALAQGKFLKVGLGVGTVIGAVMAIVKGSVALAGAIIGIAIALSYFLGWVQSDRFIQSI